MVNSLDYYVVYNPRLVRCFGIIGIVLCNSVMLWFTRFSIQQGLMPSHVTCYC